MPDFPVRLWCGYFLGAGTPLYLDIDLAGNNPVSLDPAIAAIAAPGFIATLDAAYLSTACTIGWPIRGFFRLNFVPIAPGAAPLPPAFRGGSVFGAVAIGLAQAVTRAEPSCLRYAVRPLRSVLESVRLDHVAVSADYAPNVESFAPVGCIADKLDSFFLPSLPERPAVCVVAMQQDLNARCGQAVNPPPQMDPFRFTPTNQRGFLPVLRAYDAVDALLKLWEAQSKTLANVL